MQLWTKPVSHGIFHEVLSQTTTLPRDPADTANKTHTHTHSPCGEAIILCEHTFYKSMETPSAGLELQSGTVYKDWIHSSEAAFTEKGTALDVSLQVL